MDVGAFERALEQRPEVFAAVGVDVPIHVRLGVVDDVVVIAAGEAGVGRKGVGVQGRQPLLMDLEALWRFQR